MLKIISVLQVNSEEKKQIKQKRKMDKMRRKEYIRDEKRSVKRQKREESEYRRRNKKRSGFLSWFNMLFKKSVSHPNSRNEEKDQDSKQRLRFKKNEFSQQQKSLRQQRREMRRKTRPMRRKIRQARLEQIVRQFKNFFKNPFKVKKVGGPEKLLKQQVRRDIRIITLRNIYRSPIVLYQKLLVFWEDRKMRWIFIRESVKSAFSVVRLSLSFKELRRGYYVTIINSTIFFVLAFLFVFYIHQFVTIFTASFFDIPATLYSYRIYWPLYTYSSLYSRMALVVIFGIGPLFSLVLGFVFFRLYAILRFKSVFMKTFFLWSAIHAFNLFFGAYIVGVITRTGFVYSSEWLFLTGIFDIKEILFLVGSAIALIVIGFYTTKHFLYTSNSNSLIEPKVRGMYVISKILIPWFIGIAILYLINLPNNPVELILIYLTPILIVFVSMTNYNSPSLRLVKLPRQPIRLRIAWIYLIIVILVIVGLRISLENGLNFS